MNWDVEEMADLGDGIVGPGLVGRALQSRSVMSIPLIVSRINVGPYHILLVVACSTWFWLRTGRFIAQCEWTQIRLCMVNLSTLHLCILVATTRLDDTH